MRSTKALKMYPTPRAAKHHSNVSFCHLPIKRTGKLRLSFFRKQTCCKYGSRDNRVVLALACGQLKGQRTEGDEIQGCYNDSLNLTASGRRPDGKQRTDCIHVYSGGRHGRCQSKRIKRTSTTALPVDKNASKTREPLLMLVRRPVTYAMDLTRKLRKNLNLGPDLGRHTSPHAGNEALRTCWVSHHVSNRPYSVQQPEFSSV